MEKSLGWPGIVVKSQDSRIKEDHKFKGTLGYIVNWSPGWVTQQEPVSKTTKKKKKEKNKIVSLWLPIILKPQG